MKNTSLTIAIIGLLLGLGLGYVTWGNKAPVYNQHMMPNGSMMHGSSHMDMDDMSMADMMEVMNAELRGKSGDEFDRAFITEMIVHHEGAVEMAELARTNAKHQEIKDLAEAIITAQNKEIGDMKGWLEAWY